MIKFGPAGLGSIKDAVETLKGYNKLGLKACEIAFTYGIYIKKKEDALRIKTASEKYDIQLSIHAPYWINLNSAETEKIRKSKERILKCCEVGEWLGAKCVVFHPGYYGKKTKEETYEKIKNKILEIQKEIKKNKWKIKLAPETMGKINVFGGAEEIAQLVGDTQCSFCLDFAHILARDKKVNWSMIEKLFPEKNWHCHFSGIEYGEKGEKHHRITKETEWKNLLKSFPENKNAVIINESPSSINDSAKGIEILNKLKRYPVPLCP